MKTLKFSKGDFITQISYPNTFAIFGGQAFDPIEKGGEVDYSLICFYNPSYYKQNEDGTWGGKEKVLEFDLEGESTCEYTIQIPDMEFWRLCTKEEKENALRILADEKRLAWEEDKKAFRKLATNERVMFDEDDYFRRNGGSQQPNNPYYGGYPRVNTSPSQHRTVNTVTKKIITLTVKADWEQKEPIGPMTIEHKELLLAQCDKLKYSFNSYYGGVGGTVVYPHNGAQVPRRTMGYGSDEWDAYCGYGMGMMSPYGAGWDCYD